jgi:endonuclease/exonuclease/phosphatase family metal-dependent hydrolase
MRRRLRVVSWNVGRVYSRSHNNRLHDGDLPRVGRILAELDGDVMLLQELVDGAQLQGIIAQLERERCGEFTGAIAQFCRYDRKVAALVRHGCAPAFEEHAIGTSGRSALLTSFDGGNGRRVAAIATHLDVFSPERRAEQAWAVAALAEARVEPMVIVGGDLNLDPALAQALDNRRDLASFARLTESFADAAREAGPTLLGLLRVDHFLLRGAKQWLARVSPRRLPLGDHHPLVLDVELENA